jgi:hypothetical protein
VPQKNGNIQFNDTSVSVKPYLLNGDSDLSSDSLVIDSAARPLPVKSVLSGSELQVNRLKEQELSSSNMDWITVHLVIVLALVGWIRVFTAKRLRQVIKAFFAERNMNILIREGNIFTERIAIALIIIYLITTSLFFYLIIVRVLPIKDLPFQGFRLFALVLLVILVAWVLKNVLLTITGVVFRNQLLLSEYILMNFVFSVNLGIFLIPFIILAVYLPSDEVLYAAIGLWLIAFIYRTFRQFFTGLEYTKFSYVNRFLYLCTFEIVPFLVLTKLILNELAF